MITYYPERHKGTVLICGSAPCLLEEFKEAKMHRPDAMVLAINEASEAVHADFIASMHVDRLGHFKMISKNKDASTHGPEERYKVFYHCDYYWPKVETRATSGFCGALIGRSMGFDEVVMIGCPMSGGDGYFHGRKSLSGEIRFGHSKPTKGFIKAHQQALRDHSQRFDCSMISSVCGFSSEILGRPPWRQQT